MEHNGADGGSRNVARRYVPTGSGTNFHVDQSLNGSISKRKQLLMRRRPSGSTFSNGCTDKTVLVHRMNKDGVRNALCQSTRGPNEQI